MTASQHIRHTNKPGKTYFGNFSLRFLLHVGLFCIFFGLLLVGGGAVINMQHAATASDELIDDVMPEMHHTMLLQLLLSQAAMPPNDYLIHANPDERDQYRELVEQVNGQFEILLSLPSLREEQLNTVNKTRQLWDKARRSGDALLALVADGQTPAAAVMMEKYDAEIEAAILSLDIMHEYLGREAAEYHTRLHAIVDKNFYSILGFSLVGLAIMLFGAYTLMRRVIGSVTLMQEGVNAFAKGDFEYRVPSQMPIELGQVAAGMNDMAEKLGASYRELERHSYRDGLTGSLNKRKLDEDIVRELSRAHRYKEQFSILLLDLDLFKQVNDSYGHQAGDEVLRQLVQRVDHQLRTADSLYRYGGEEFVVILPQTEVEGALVTAERICRSVEHATVRVDGDRFIPITVSIGVATYPQDGSDAQHLVESADKGMYRAKTLGRNCVAHIQG